MSSLIGLFKENKKLQFIDGETGEVWSMTQFQSKSWLKDQPKQLAFLYLDNSLESIQTILYFLDSPHAFVLLNPQLHITFKSELEAKYLPNFIFDSKRSEIEGFEKTFFLRNSALFSRFPKEYYKIDDKVKVLLTTSGTTGSPKFVKLSEDNLLSNALSITQFLPIKKTDCTPLNLSIYYSYGLSVLTSNSIAGGTIVCTNKDVLNKEFWLDFEKFGYTSLAGVPYVYEMLNRIGFLKKDYPSLRYMTQAGGKLNSKLVELFYQYLTKFNKLFYVMYGQTEATARMSYLPPKALPSKLGSIGIPIPQGGFHIDNISNELIYQGPNIFGGYAESFQDLSTFDSSEKLFTGDVAKKDEDGFYYVTGRIKRFVKIFGIRTNLDEIENILRDEFLGFSFFAIGTDDEKLILFTSDASINEVDIKLFLKEKLQIHPSVVTIKIIQNIPLTSNGKVNYSILINYV